MHYSTSLNVFNKSLFDRRETINKALDRCKAAGFQQLDLNYWDYLVELIRKSPAEEEAWAKSLQESAAERGIRFTQMHGPVHGRSFADMMHGWNVDSYLERVKQSLHTAAILQIPWVVFHPTNISSSGFETLEENVSFNCQFFSKLLPLAEQLGVGIALENIYDRNPNYKDTVYRNVGAVPEELCIMIDRIDHPLVGACWDTGHAHMQGLPQGKSIRMLGKRLKAMHVHDNDGKKDQHLLPYYGTIDWKDMMSALHEIGYEGGFTYEAHNAIHILPDPLRDTALRLAAEIAHSLTKGEA